jgi:hypothetical protein
MGFKGEFGGAQLNDYIENMDQIWSMYNLQNSSFNLTFGQNLMFFHQFDVNYDQKVPKLHVSIDILMKNHQVWP